MSTTAGVPPPPTLCATAVYARRLGGIVWVLPSPVPTVSDASAPPLPPLLVPPEMLSAEFATVGVVGPGPTRLPVLYQDDPIRYTNDLEIDTGLYFTTQHDYSNTWQSAGKLSARFALVLVHIKPERLVSLQLPSFITMVTSLALCFQYLCR
jgi:hypothetical protein